MVPHNISYLKERRVIIELRVGKKREKIVHTSQ